MLRFGLTCTLFLQLEQAVLDLHGVSQVSGAEALQAAVGAVLGDGAGDGEQVDFGLRGAVGRFPADGADEVLDVEGLALLDFERFDKEVDAKVDEGKLFAGLGSPIVDEFGAEGGEVEFEIEWFCVGRSGVGAVFEVRRAGAELSCCSLWTCGPGAVCPGGRGAARGCFSECHLFEF